jgi:hypothetical protein
MINKVLKLTLFIFVSALFMASCQEDEPAADPQPVDTSNPYMGDWEGTFEGDDNGTWNIVVDKEGDFTGQLFSENAQSNHPMNGSFAEDGTLTATIDVDGVIIDFTGKGTNGNTASGTWSNPAFMISGTWSGNKK